MDIGIPRETRLREHRVALAPSAVKTLVQRGHRVWAEADAGLAAGHPNAEYQAAGAQIAYSRHEVFARAALVATVFAPDPGEYAHLPKDQILFGFWALPAARPEDLKTLAESEVTAVGLEAIEDASGCAPVRTSMSEIAGSLAVIVGVSKDSAARAIRSLTDAGIVERVDHREARSGRFSSTTYRVDLASAGITVVSVSQNTAPAAVVTDSVPTISRSPGDQLSLLD